MNEKRYKTETRLLSGTAIYSVEQQYAALIKNDVFVDSQNMRSTQVTHDAYVRSKIGGETLKYDLIDNGYNGTDYNFSQTYKCMFAIGVSGKLFEIWCDILGNDPTFFRVNGIVVAKSANIPYDADHLIKGHKDDGNHDVFLTDRTSPPHNYNIDDLLIAMGYDPDTMQQTGSPTAKYFNDYTDLLYVINQLTNADHPVFIECTTVQPQNATAIGSGGQKAGSVQYAFRFKDSEGNPSGWSAFCPLIPVPRKASPVGNTYPFTKTYGAAVAAETSMGVHFQFRITNIANFTSYEVRRISFNTGAPLQSVGVDELIYSENIEAGQISIKDIWDIGATGTAYNPEADEAATLAVINSCGDVRYYNKRLYLFDVEYASRELATTTFVNIETASQEDVIVPAMKFLGEAGHKDVYNQVYYKSYMHEELGAFGVVGHDGFGQTSFVKQITGTSEIYPQCGDYENFRFPKRRDGANGNVSAVASFDVVTPFVRALDMNYDLNYTFDVMQYENFRQKDPGYTQCQYKNIMKFADPTKYRSATDVATNSYGCPLNINGGQQSGSEVPVNYQPWRPTRDVDNNISGYDFSPNSLRWLDDSTSSADAAKGFGPEYLSLGLNFGGVDNVDGWVKAISVVKNMPQQNRVVAQGLAMYDMHRNEAPYSNTNKYNNKVIFYSPDIESGLFNIEDLINFPENYELHIQTPLGFFTEVYNAHTNDNDGDPIHYSGTCNIDMISYARIMFENGTINAGDNTSNVGINGHVSFTNWRNSIYQATHPASEEWDIIAVTAKTSISGEQTTYEIELDNESSAYTIYNQEDSNNTVADNQFSNATMKKFHEPLYIVNIVRKNAAIDTSPNIKQFIQTGAYVKMESIVGKSDGSDRQVFPLVDERWEDCITTSDAVDKFIYVKDAHGQVTKWVNIASKDAGQINTILTDIDTGTGTYGNCSGVYSQETTQVNGSTRFYSLVFDLALNPPSDFYDTFFVPAEGSFILVRYDNRFPIAVFGGDCVTGEAVFAPLDNLITNGGTVFGDLPIPEQPYFGLGWPYLKWTINPRVFTTQGDRILDTTTFMLWIVRQLTMMFTCTSRSNVPLTFNDTYPAKSFPLVHYVMRPNTWDTTKTIIGNNVYEQYLTDYPEEVDADGNPVLWQRGGFRFKQTFENTNIDYSHLPRNIIYFSKPRVGFTEVTRFRTRVQWSAKRDVNEQNSPSLKTFPALNFRDIQDTYGAITKGYDCSTNDGNNLYAFAENGLCLLLTSKFIARQNTGEPFATIGSDQEIAEEIWLSNDHGLPNEMWRTFAEHDNVCWFTNYESAWRFEENNLVDIAREYYRSRIYNDFIAQITTQGYSEEVFGYVDHHHMEYWTGFRRKEIILVPDDRGDATITTFQGQNQVYVQYDNPNWEGTPINVLLPNPSVGITSLYVINKTDHTITVTGISPPIELPSMTGAYFTYSDGAWDVDIDSPPQMINPARYNVVFVWKDADKDSKWEGYYDYAFDKFTVIGTTTYGSKMGEGTFTLDSGVTMNGENVVASVIIPFVGGEDFAAMSKDFARFRVVTNDIRPTLIEFYQTIEQVRAQTPLAFLDVSTDQYYVRKLEGGYEAFIPRKNFNPFDRIQGKIILMRVVYSGTEQKFDVINASMFFNLII